MVIFKSADITAYNQAVEGFRATIGNTSTISEYDLQGDLARGRKLARKVRASNADLILAVGTKAALAVKLEVVDIPVLFCMVLDPEKNGLNGSNMTGIMLEVPVEQQFATLRSMLPAKKRLGVLYDPDKTGELLDEARRQARGLGLELVTRAIRSEKEVPSALRSLIPLIDAVWLVPDSTVLTEESISFLLATALDANLPVIGFSAELVRSGALAGLSVSYEDIGRQAAGLARKMLNGQLKPPSKFPPERVRLALNLKTAKFLGITIPSEVVNHADQLY